MKRIFVSTLLPVLGLTISSAQADDSDIYINDPGAPPYAVFALDYRPNIFSSTCSDTGHPQTDPTKAASCLDTLGESYTIDPVTGYVDTSNAPIYNFITSSTGLNKSDTAIDPWEQMVAVYAVALKLIPKEINIALAISHNDTCTGGGATAGPTVSGCSNGGYILKGFTAVSPDDTTGADALIEKLKAIPNASTGSVTHLFQGAELYYEISRYLRGEEIYNAHLGWDSYVSNSKGTDEYNLNDAANLAADGRATASSVGYVGSDPDTSIVDTGSYAFTYPAIPQYTDPYTANSNTNECTKTYVINNFFKESQQESNSNAAIVADADLGLDSVGSDPFLDLVTAFATEPFANGQPVQSVFIAGEQAVNAGKVPNYSVAGTPEGEDEIGPYSRDNAKEFLEGLVAALNSILSKSATFVAASVPVNVFNRVEVVDNVYLALFQADRDSKPFWPGNVKKLKIVADPNDNTARIIVDALYDANAPVTAFDTDGRIKRDALTFWTDASGYDMDANFSSEDLDVADRDGRSIMRGGAGQQIPGLINGTNQGSPGVNNQDAGAATDVVGDPAPRQLYTEPTSTFADGSTDDDISGDSLIPLNADTTLSGDADIQSALGVASASDAVELLAWFRGLTAVDTNLDGELATFSGAAGSRDSVVTRNWFLGDALHSQPLPVNYGCSDPAVADCEQRIRLFFGTNDGVFHMVRNTHNTSGDEKGDEIAGFIPQSSLKLASILSGGPTIPVHPYGMDGRPVSVVIDNDNDGHIESTDNDKVYVFVTMRRGGDEIFAFDASNPDIPMKLMWKLNSDNSDFSELGMTFSNPAVGVIQTGVQSEADGGAVEQQLALIFAGGFCGGWESDYSARVCKDLEGFMGPDTEGAAIYMADALTGDLIWKATGGVGTSSVPNTSPSNHFVHADMIHSIPSDIAVFDSNENGILDRGYVGDTGGNIWRIDFPEAQRPTSDVTGLAVDGREQWFVSLFAQLGIDAVDPSATDAFKAENDRRFFHAPDVVQTYMENNTPVDKIVITSGDRPHPREEDVQNGVFVLNDFHIYTGDSTLLDETTGEPVDDPISKAELADTVLCLSDSTATACTGAAADTEGWYLDYVESGEKGLSRPLVLEGTLFATSYLPNGEPGAGGSVDICAPPEGSSRLYALNLNNGAPTVHLSDTLDNKYVPIGDGLLGDVKPLGSDYILVPGTGVDGEQIVKASGRSQVRIYWYEKGLDVP